MDIKNYLENFFHYTKAFFRNHRILENSTFFLSIITINFASYLSYFDFNLLALIDTSVITNHLASLVITFAIVSAVVTLLYTFTKNTIAGFNRIISRFDQKSEEEFLIQKKYLEDNKERLEIERQIIEDEEKERTKNDIIYRIEFRTNVLDKIVRYFLICLVFSYFYIGIKNGLLIIFVLGIFFFSLAWLEHVSESNPLPVKGSKKLPKKLNFKSFISPSLYLVRITLSEFQHTIKLILRKYREENFVYFVKKAGIITLLLSVALGVARANFVQDNIVVKLDHDDIFYTLIMKSANGVGLFNSDEKKVIFISWDTLEKITFVQEKRRSISTILVNML